MGKLGMGVLGLAADAIDKHGIAALSPAAMLMGLGKDKKAEAAPAAEDEKKKRAMMAMKGRGMGRGMQAPGMKKGGKVRGSGCCKKGVRKCKMR
jgi:hypothetical protein